MKIPDDIFERVFDLATKLTDASATDDTKTYWQLYNELRDFCEEEISSGRNHPFLLESLADFTTDDRASISLYLKALEAAARAGAKDYEASIGLAVAERYRAIGDGPRAYKFALEANEKAKQLDDLDLRKDISEFLLEEAKKPGNKPKSDTAKPRN